MTTLAEFFEREAASNLQLLRSQLAPINPDAAAIHRTARTLRGSAQMAREERVYRAALALETAVKPAATASAPVAGPLLGCVRAAVDDLAVLVEGADPSPELDGRLRASLERWQAVGVELPPPVLGRRTATESAGSMREFRAYAAREIDGIAEALEEGMRALRLDPMDREALKSILRRQRALRGAARLEEIPVVAEILRAVEDLTRVVAKLDVAVKQEWFDVYRTAREGLAAAIPALGDDRDPQPSSALARLRHLRTELLARYGAGEAVNPAAGQREGMGQAQRVSADAAALAAAASPLPSALPRVLPRSVPPTPRPAPSGGGRPVPAPPAAGHAPAAAPVAGADSAAAEPVPISTLEYSGEAALVQALTLRAQLERALPDDRAARELLDELFDLIRLALE